MRLVIEGIVIIIVPFVASFLFNVISLLAAVFNLVACVSTMNDVLQVRVVPVLSSATLLQRRETYSRVPMWALAVVRILTMLSISALEYQVHHGGCVQHCLEAFNLRVDFFTFVG
jgi:hypothetical protein